MITTLISDEVEPLDEERGLRENFIDIQFSIFREI